MIDGKYFELNHGNRETAPDGLINNLDLLNDIHTFIDLLKAMEPYKSRKPAFTAAKIVELVMERQINETQNHNPVLALVIMLMITIRERVNNKPSTSVPKHLAEIFSAEVLEILQSDLSSIPYREIPRRSSGANIRLEDYSVVRTLGDRFPIEAELDLEFEEFESEETQDCPDFEFEIIDEADLAPEADEEEGE